MRICVANWVGEEWQWQWQWIMFTTMIFALLVAYYFIRFGGDHGNSKEAPGTTGCPFFGETFAFIAANKSCKGVYEFVHQRHLRFGPVFKTRIFGKTHVFMPGPQVAKLVLRGEFSEFSKSYFKSMQEAVGEHSLLCVKEESHRKLRRMLGDLLSSAEALANSLPHIDSLFTLSLAQWTHISPPASIRVVDYALDVSITFKIMCGMLMSVDVGDEKLVKDMRKDVDHVSDAMLCLPIYLPGTRYYTGVKARERLIKSLEEVIDRRRRGEEYRDDFLQSMLAHNNHDHDHVGISDVEVKDNILTLILAGQTTTAAAMMWAVKYLDLNPHVQHKLRVEQEMVRQRMKAEDGRDHLKMEDVNTMTYTSKVVKEVLRMASIVSWMPRLALNDCTVQGFEVKKGWILNVDARFTHFDPSIYRDPMKFNPSRFEEKEKAGPPAYAFLAFGGGVRTCLGMNLAKLMITVFLHRLVTAYRWKVEDEDMSLEAWAHFPRLGNGCPVSVTRSAHKNKDILL